MNDLFMLHTLDNDELEDFALKKGLHHLPKRKLGEKIIVHGYGNHKPLGMDKYVLVQFYNKKECLRTTFSTFSEQEYVLLKKDFKQKGYVFESSNGDEKISVSYYFNEKSRKFTIAVAVYFDELCKKNNYSVDVINKEVSGRYYAEKRSLEN